jgi:hypothetical protein
MNKGSFGESTVEVLLRDVPRSSLGVASARQLVSLPRYCGLPIGNLSGQFRANC